MAFSLIIRCKSVSLFHTRLDVDRWSAGCIQCSFPRELLPKPWYYLDVNSIFKYQQKLINFSSVHILPFPPCVPPRSITTMFVLSPVDVIILRQCCCLCCNNWTVLHNVDLCGWLALPVGVGRQASIWGAEEEQPISQSQLISVLQWFIQFR